MRSRLGPMFSGADQAAAPLLANRDDQGVGGGLARSVRPVRAKTNSYLLSYFFVFGCSPRLEIEMPGPPDRLQERTALQFATVAEEGTRRTEGPPVFLTG